MGTLREIFTDLTTTKDVRTDLLLIRAMALGATCDGPPSAGQAALMKSLLLTLPELNRQRSAAQHMLGMELASEPGERAARIASFAAIPRMPTRRKCYVVAAELALAGAAGERARDTLDPLRAALRLDEAYARTVEEVLSIRRGGQPSCA